MTAGYIVTETISHGTYHARTVSTARATIGEAVADAMASSPYYAGAMYRAQVDRIAGELADEGRAEYGWATYAVRTVPAPGITARGLAQLARSRGVEI